MSFRFRRSVRLAPGIRLNFSRSGVSTTFGGRGMSVNMGRRGTFLNAGIPGTGIHARSRVGGRGRSAALGSAGNELAGCFGCGGVGLLLLMFVGFCGSLASSGGSAPGAGSYGAVPLAVIDSSYQAPQQRATYYAHGKVNVRSGAGSTYAVVRTLSRGEQIQAGDADARGWAPAYDGSGQRIGYVYLHCPRLRAEAPPTPGERSHERRSERRNPSGATAICRDGTYSNSKHRRGTCSHHGGVAQRL